jgi:cell division protein FtsW
MNYKRYDTILLINCLLLVAIGIIAVFTASTEIAYKLTNNRLYFLFKQSFWVFVSIFFLVISTKIPLTFLQQFSRVFLLASFIMLILVLVVGHEVNGGSRWFHFGFIRIQPSSIAILSMIIFSADYLYRRNDELDDFKRLFTLLVILGVFALLIAAQPDFSTALMMSSIVFLMIFCSTTSLKNILVLFFGGVGLSIPVLILKPYRIERIKLWLASMADGINLTDNLYWQAKQSLISFGVGGFSGVGLGQSRQKYFFLPEAHTDYIFAIIGEEMGLIGTLLVMFLFLVIIWRAIRITNRAQHTFHYYLSCGISFYLSLYILINILVVLNVLPSTGLPLPFISYGGSQLIVSMICIGLLLNISSKTPDSVVEEYEEYHDA